MRKILLTVLCAAALFAADGLRRAPGFALPDIKGDIHDLYDYRGKIVLLEFMQTTCPHCAVFAAALDNAQKKYGAKVQVLSVVFPPDAQPQVREYIASHRIDYPILFDCGQMGYSYIRKQTVDFPHLYMIDRDGIIRGDWTNTDMNVAGFELDTFVPAVDRLLSAAPSKAAPKK
jgi:peroxiredoxin